ncbi:MAG: S-layer homology domain-containing protein [Firmicutes bacterium]|nr:S-layer homology domain-containing protein [Bacillota bacterium]
MSKLAQKIIIAALVLLLLPAPGLTSFGEEASGDAFRVIGYYSADLFDEPAEHLQTNKLTHVMYAFLIPRADGTCLPPPKPEQLQAVTAQAHRDGAKVFAALGGWSYNGVPLASTFETVTADEALRKKLVDSVLAVVDEYDLDGVELDWEYPTEQSAGNYEKLVLELSAALEARGKHLTAALNGAWSKTGAPAVSELVSEACLDAFQFISVMSYDMNNEQHSPFWFANTSIEYWLNRDVPAEKIVLGMPLYARPSWAQYRHLVAEDPDFAYTDHAASAIGDSYYNGLPTLCRKTLLAFEKAGGVMLFDVNEDADGPLSAVSMIDGVLTDLNEKGYLSPENVELIQMNGGAAELTNAVGWDYTRAKKRMWFKDVNESDWFYDAVDYVYQNNQMNGLSRTVFAPGDSLTRAMLVTILWRMDGSPSQSAAQTALPEGASQGSSSPFIDIESGSWYEEAVNWAQENGVVNGFEDGRFRPDLSITREQVITILYRYIKAEPPQSASQTAPPEGEPRNVLSSLDEYSDVCEISPWALESMRWGVGSGLISGRGNGRLAPKASITRAEAAALLQRADIMF